MEQHSAEPTTSRKIAGIVRGKWSYNEKEYLVEALDFYDEAIYINPRKVTYRFERESGVTAIDYHGRRLDKLAMLYTFGYALEIALLAKSLQMLGRPVSDPYPTISRECLAKISGSLDFLSTRSGTTTHLLTSYAGAQDYFARLEAHHFPLLNKPIQGNQGRGIVALKDAAEALDFARRHFRRSDQFLMLERHMNYPREWRIYLIDGNCVEAYEKQKAAGRIVANLHQGGSSLKVDPGLKEELFEFVLAHLPAAYESGVYGVDLALTDEGAYHIVEINRTPGFRGFKDVTGRSFPRLVHERLVTRARGVRAAEAPIQVLTFLGDTNPGESYQLRNEEKGRENILKSRGYDYGMASFARILEDSNFTVANLEAALTGVRESALHDVKPYLDWSDPVETPALLRRAGIHAVSLANNHSMDFGEKGLGESLHALRSFDIAAIGAGMDAETAAEVLHHVVEVGREELHIIIATGFEFRKNHGEWGYYADADKPGVNAWGEASARGQISRLREAHPDAFIIAFPHWGGNYTFKSERQRRLGVALADGGADLIIGHGAHMLQEVERYKDKWIVYGLGNFVYNSPGRFEQQGKAGYGMIARLHVYRDGSLWLRLYPICTDNRKTNYQSRFVTPEEFNETLAFLMPYQGEHNGMEDYLGIGKDGYGLYFDCKVR